jgi:hypothetical protein
MGANRSLIFSLNKLSVNLFKLKCIVLLTINLSLWAVKNILHSFCPHSKINMLW